MQHIVKAILLSYITSSPKPDDFTLKLFITQSKNYMLFQNRNHRLERIVRFKYLVIF